MKTAREYSTRVVQEGGRRCKKSTLNDLVHLTPLRIPLLNPPTELRFTLLIYAAPPMGVHACPLSLYLQSRTLPIAVYAPAESVDTPQPTSFHFYHMCTLWQKLLKAKATFNAIRDDQNIERDTEDKRLSRFSTSYDSIWLLPHPPFSRPFHSHVQNSGF